jgi:hypothetical protein
MDFEEALNELFGLIGTEVSVSVCDPEGESPLIAELSGKLERGTELGEPGTADESYAFAIGRRGSLLVDRAVFAGGRWEADVLALELGPVVVRVAAEEG